MGCAISHNLDRCTRNELLASLPGRSATSEPEGQGMEATAPVMNPELPK